MEFKVEKSTSHSGSHFGKWVLLVSILGGLIGLSLIFGAWKLFRKEFPEVTTLKNHYAHILYQGPKKPVLVRLEKSIYPGYTALGQVSKVAQGAVIVSEDWAFFTHDGFDAAQLKEALEQDLVEHRFARGASTITMQVVKNVYLTQEKSLWRKLKEFLLAIRLDHHVPKRKILETYFNIAEWGEGIYGISGASQTYFGKNPADINPREAAFLAMLLPSPKKYSQSFRAKKLTPFGAKMVKSILTKMAQAHYITDEDKNFWIKTPMAWETSLTPSDLTGSADESENGDSTEETPRTLDSETHDKTE